jgi:hypothetical protein
MIVSFVTSAAILDSIQELCKAPCCFSRTLNARSIMSGVISDMAEPDEYSCCIMYPDIASESTYH